MPSDEREGPEKDKARLDWLEANRADLTAWAGRAGDRCPWTVFLGGKVSLGKSAREAIDNAMEASHAR